MAFIVLFCLLIMVGAVISIVYRNPKHWEYRCVGDVIMFTGVMCLLIALVFIPFYRNAITSEMEKFEATKYTIESARDNDDTTQWERIALTERVVDSNGWLARCQYYAQHPWYKLYYPKEVLDLELID